MLLNDADEMEYTIKYKVLGHLFIFHCPKMENVWF